VNPDFSNASLTKSDLNLKISSTFTFDFISGDAAPVIRSGNIKHKAKTSININRLLFCQPRTEPVITLVLNLPPPKK
jgi:hypothetical protein